jgi:hypothetical protein
VTGRITGISRYPAPNFDHTVASGKDPGETSVHVPTTSTPASSTAQHTSATRRAVSPPRTSVYVMNA